MSEVASAPGTGDPVEDPEIAIDGDWDGDEVTPHWVFIPKISPIKRYLDIYVSPFKSHAAYCLVLLSHDSSHLPQKPVCTQILGYQLIASGK